MTAITLWLGFVAGVWLVALSCAIFLSNAVEGIKVSATAWYGLGIAFAMTVALSFQAGRSL